MEEEKSEGMVDFGGKVWAVNNGEGHDHRGETDTTVMCDSDSAYMIMYRQGLYAYGAEGRMRRIARKGMMTGSSCEERRRMCVAPSQEGKAVNEYDERRNCDE